MHGDTGRHIHATFVGSTITGVHVAAPRDRRSCVPSVSLGYEMILSLVRLPVVSCYILQLAWQVGLYLFIYLENCFQMSKKLKKPKNVGTFSLPRFHFYRRGLAQGEYVR
jgi:hypothetical protein